MKNKTNILLTIMISLQIIILTLIPITYVLKNDNNVVSASADYYGYPSSGFSNELPYYTDRVYETREQQTVQYGYVLDTYFTLMGQTDSVQLSLAVDTSVFYEQIDFQGTMYDNYYMYTFNLSSPNPNAPTQIRIGYGKNADFGTVNFYPDSDNFFGFGYVIYYDNMPPNVQSYSNPTNKYYTITELYNGETGVRIDNYIVTNTFSSGGPYNADFNVNSLYRYLDEEQLIVKDAFKYAYEKGFQDGYTDGKQDGIEQGYGAGHTDGYNSGYSNGYNKGLEDGIEQGYEQGYEQGLFDNTAYLDGYEQGLKDAPNNPLSNIWGMVDGFLSYEFLPNFSFKTMLLICLGCVGLMIILKMFLGG